MIQQGPRRGEYFGNETVSVESIHLLEEATPTQEETETLVDHLEDVLRRLAYPAR